jgi:flavin-dependent dehydrogenase
VIPTEFDAVVLGAGPAGLATAVALRRRIPASVLVVDGGRPERDRVGETAAPGLLLDLERLGLATRFSEGGHLPCPGTASIWGRDRVGYNDFVLDPLGPAWRLDRPRFDRMLLEAAQESGAVLQWCTRFAGLVPGGSGNPPHRLRLTSREGGEVVVFARCVVDATGPGAWFARALGARRRVDDRLFAAVRFGAAATAGATRQTLVEAVPDGWWYGARTPGDQAVVMFVTDRSGVGRLRAGGPAAFEAALAETSLVRTLVSAPAAAAMRHTVLPIWSSALDRRAGDGWVAVGDAAASFDPIAGQGVAKALADGLAGAEQVHALLEGGVAAAVTGGAPDEVVAGYRLGRAAVYGSETRFPGAPFWQTRQARARLALDA